MPDDCKDIEGEIRTDTHRRNFFKLIEEDINELINPYRDGGRQKEKYFYPSV